MFLVRFTPIADTYTLVISLNLSALSWLVCTIPSAGFNIIANVNNSFTFFIWFITYNFSSILMIFCWFFTWIALGDVDWHFSLMLLSKTSGVEEETTWTKWLHQCKQSKHVTNCVTVMSLSASLNHKISVAMGHLCQIVLNQKSSHKFKKWHKFSSRVKVKSCKKKSHAMRYACEREVSLNYAQCPEHNSSIHPNILNFGMRWRSTAIFISCVL